jgi:manganese-dependent inorganic pyrophosphatase
MIKIFGHKSPDTDATCSAIIWSYYLNHLKKTPATPYILGQANQEAAFVLKYWDTVPPSILTDVSPHDTVIIVDTNNPAELPNQINTANIIQIIDHHKLVGGLTTTHPIEITIKRLASTASVMASLMTETEKNSLPREIKGLMLSCIISDTLAFRSPTTTDYDTTLANDLATELNLDLTDYAYQMFAAKSNVSHLSAKELIFTDSKNYPIQTLSIQIAVVETTDPKSILDRQTEIETAIIKLKNESNEIDEVMFFVIDIIQQQATLFINNDTIKAIAIKSFEKTVTGKTLMLPGVVSRKKQIVPILKY